MADKFMQHDGIETGYFAKRKEQFNAEVSKGIASVGVPAKVQSKPKSKTNSKKDAPKVEKPKVEKPNADVPPSQLTGQAFVDRMKAAKEAKAKAQNA